MGEQDINEYRRRVAEWARRQQFQLRYTWVMELHKNGKPHYHVLFFIPAPSLDAESR
ncbi:MAG: inovirus-type Gp2 protein [Gammaproteobacteria bacterium]